MKNTEELIWRYLDGACSPEETAAIEKRMEEDPDFKSFLLERKRLSGALNEMEAEQPSMRFVRNIMDQLPEIYRRTVDPLISPFWIKAFFGILAIVLVGYGGLVVYSLQSGHALDPESQVSSATEQFTGLFSGLPFQVLTLMASVSVAYLLLVLLDQRLKKTILEKKKEG